jgi:hypothetical protein
MNVQYYCTIKGDRPEDDGSIEEGPVKKAPIEVNAVPSYHKILNKLLEERAKSAVLEEKLAFCQKKLRV